ncbi:MAG: LysM peptidoglycan-binding domain-containing protein [Enterococcus sp.]
MGESLSRKERRKVEEQRTFYRNMKKSAAVLGTTITTISAVAPLSPMVTVLADETDIAVEEATAHSIDTSNQTSTEATTVVEETDESIEEITTETEIEVEVTPESSEVIEDILEQPAVVPTEPVVVEPEITEPEIAEPEIKAPVDIQAPFAAPAAARSRMSAMDPQTFISTVSQYAVPVANANDLYASVMIAQAIIESGWGGSTLSQAPNYNLFGIKGSYQGQTVYMSTLEYLNGQWVTKNEPFRKYPSFAESFADNAYTLRNVSLQPGVYYYSGAWKSNTTSYRDATAWLTGRYATDPSYASKLNNVIESYQLTRFDTSATGKPSTPNVPGQPETPSTPGNNTGAGTYTVKSGDYLSLIAQNHGITVAQLRSWNNLKGDLIYPGQKLIVKKPATDELTPTPPKPDPNPPTNTGTGQKPSTSNQTYTVKSGDSVWLIANNHGITMDQLRSWNNLKGDLIHPGQKLIVKQGSVSESKPTPPTNQVKPTPPSTGGSTQTPSTGNQTYTVKSGDSVWLIANNHGISMDQLRSWNGLKGDLIHPGQKLIVKQGTGGTTNPTPPTNQVKPTPPSTGGSTQAPSTGNQTYTVKSGDSVWLIANNHGISMDQLRSLNNIKGDLIHPGQKLIVKKSATSNNNTGNQASNKPAAPSNGQSHKVVSGDSLWALSVRYGVSIQQLKTTNNLKSDIIYVGQTLKV